MEALVPNELARDRLHRVVGYWLTGCTTRKAFDQLSAPASHGKTKFLEIIANAGGRFVVMNVVPVEEVSSPSNFEDTLASVLMQQPPPRVLFFDETKKNAELQEKLVNMATSGSDSIVLPCRIKGHGATLVKSVAKWVISSNHVLKSDASATGQTLRRQGVPFLTEFVSGPLTAASPPHRRVMNPELVGRLLSPEGRAGVARWIVEGAHDYFHFGEGLSLEWDKQTFKLRRMGDPYVNWLAEHYIPTGTQHDRVEEDVLVGAFDSDNKHLKGTNTREGIRQAFGTMTDFIEKSAWGAPAPFYGAEHPVAPPIEVIGYVGLRKRVVGDPDWTTAASIAKEAFDAIRAGEM